MINGLLGKKVGMTQIFDKEGNIIPVTLIETGPCKIVELLDSPLKVKVGFDETKESRVTKPLRGMYKKAGVNPMRICKEFFSSDNKDYTIGQEIKADLFKPGDYVDISGKSIGKGFQGGMKRWGWSGGPAGHGSRHHRRVGSIGACADPSKTNRGRHMPGQMGATNVTVQGLRVMDVNSEKNIILVKGAVPGCVNAIVTLNLSKKKKFKALDEKKKVVVHKVNPMKQSKAKAGASKAKGKSKGKKK